MLDEEVSDDRSYIDGCGDQSRTWMAGVLLRRSGTVCCEVGEIAAGVEADGRGWGVCSRVILVGNGSI